jgi:hypothetical protein
MCAGAHTPKWQVKVRTLRCRSTQGGLTCNAIAGGPFHASRNSSGSLVRLAAMRRAAGEPIDTMKLLVL